MSSDGNRNKAWLERLANGEVDLDDPGLRLAARSDPELRRELAALDRVRGAIGEEAREAAEVIELVQTGPAASSDEKLRRVFLEQFEAARVSADSRPVRPRAFHPRWWVVLVPLAATLLFLWYQPSPQHSERRTQTPLGLEIRAIEPPATRAEETVERFRVELDAPASPGRRLVFHVYDSSLERIASSDGDDADPTDTIWTPSTPIRADEIRWEVEVQESYVEVARSALFSSVRLPR